MHSEGRGAVCQTQCRFLSPPSLELGAATQESPNSLPNKQSPQPGPAPLKRATAQIPAGPAQTSQSIRKGSAECAWLLAPLSPWQCLHSTLQKERKAPGAEWGAVSGLSPAHPAGPPSILTAPSWMYWSSAFAASASTSWVSLSPSHSGSPDHRNRWELAPRRNKHPACTSLARSCNCQMLPGLPPVTDQPRHARHDPLRQGCSLNCRLQCVQAPRGPAPQHSRNN